MLNGMVQQFFNGRKEFKPMLISVLRGLDLVSAYSVYESSARMRAFFKDNDVWYILWRTWYPDTHEEMTKSIQSVVPNGKRINYLWVLFAHHIASNGFREFTIESLRGKGVIGDYFHIEYEDDYGSFAIKIFQLEMYSGDHYYGPPGKYVLFDVHSFNSKDQYTAAHIVTKNFGIQNLTNDRDAIKMKYSHESLMKTVYEIMITFPGATIRRIFPKDDNDRVLAIHYVRSQIK